MFLSQGWRSCQGDLDSIRRSLQDVIDKGAKLEAKVKGVIQASDLTVDDH